MPSAHVIGLGKSGIAAARLLKQDGWEVILSDSASTDSLQKQQQELDHEGITVKLGYSFKPTVSIELIVVSPGVPWDLPALVNARKMGIETIGEMGLAWRSLQSSPWVAITGTNGKTTTTALIAAIFQAAGFHAPACGNIGYAACELALEVVANSKTQNALRAAALTKFKTQNSIDWIIAELSSYQIESSPSVAPRIGVWTTFTPDHLSYYLL